MENLYEYYLHYNPYTELWNAVKRGEEMDYMNGKLDKDKVIKMKKIEDLIKVISTGKAGGK